MEQVLTTKDYKRFRLEPSGITFEGAAAAGRALPGDTVLLKGDVCELVERRTEPLFLVGTVEVNSKTRYGMTARGAPIYKFTPFDEAYPPFFVGCSIRDTSCNILGRVQFESWDAGTTCPRANLIQSFGCAGSLEAEESALTAHYGPLRWKRGEAGDLVKPLWGAATEPLTGETFHIDPLGCRDIDDAVTLRHDGDTISLEIHIADVASWLSANPALAEKPAAIGQTLYCDGVPVRPMFPPELSEDLFSLLPGKERYAWTLGFRVEGGTITEPTWTLRRIRVTGSYTYDTAVSAPWAPILTKVASVLAGRPVTDSHEWVEQLMLHYNREVARLLHSHQAGVLRRHTGPDRERFERYKALGLPAERLAMRAGEYCSPTEPDTAHWGLSSPVYCHASSPIRRWADCLNQIALRRILLYSGEGIATVQSEEVAALNASTRRCKQYERDLLFLRSVVGADAVRHVDGTVAEERRVYVATWGRLVKVEGLPEPGTPVRLRLFCDATKPNWKRRLVFSLSRNEGDDTPSSASSSSPYPSPRGKEAF
jgi:hypothetical protein